MYKNDPNKGALRFVEKEIVERKSPEGKKQKNLLIEYQLRHTSKIFFSNVYTCTDFFC